MKFDAPLSGAPQYLPPDAGKLSARKRKARLGERAFGERRKLENGKDLPLLFLGWLFRCHN
jgi:hypothetical protein